MFDLLLLLSEQNRAGQQYLSSLSPICPNDTIKNSTTAVQKENKFPLLAPCLDLFFSFCAQTVRWRSQQPASRSNNGQLRWSILTSRAPASEELRCREQDREREEAALRRKREMKD
jgi:hypothetical protein